MNRHHVNAVRKTIAQAYGKEQRDSGKFWGHALPDWYLAEIQRLSKKYRPIRWLPLDVPKFEIDKNNMYLTIFKTFINNEEINYKKPLFDRIRINQINKDYMEKK